MAEEVIVMVVDHDDETIRLEETENVFDTTRSTTTTTLYHVLHKSVVGFSEYMRIREKTI